MAKGNKQIQDWLKEESRYIKVKVGERYSCIFRGMEYDETGGFKGKPTVRYSLEDLDDGKTREMSSSSKVLAQKMMKAADGDQLTIIGLLSEDDRKTYNVIFDEASAEDDDEDEKDKDDEEEEEERPRRGKKGRIDPKKIPF